MAVLFQAWWVAGIPAQAEGKPQPPQPAFAPVRDDPKLPRVLLLGDSISIGYTPTVRARLAGVAKVHFTAEGSERLGAEVARVIADHLPKSGDDLSELASGVVFHDANANGTREAGERPLAGVRVSNGREIVRTDQQGAYQLPIADDAYPTDRRPGSAAALPAD